MPTFTITSTVPVYTILPNPIFGQDPTITITIDEPNRTQTEEDSTTGTTLPFTGTITLPTSQISPQPTTVSNTGELTPSPNPVASDSHGPLSNAGTIGLSVGLAVAFFLAAVVFCFYRRQKKSHAKAMLIAPRIPRSSGSSTMKMTNLLPYMSNGHPGNSMAQWPGGQQFNGYPRQSMDRNAHPSHNYWREKSDEAIFELEQELDHFRIATSRPETIDSAARRMIPPYAEMYEGTWTPERLLSNSPRLYDSSPAAEEKNTPQFNEALRRLNALRQDLKPPSVRTVTNSIPGANNYYLHPPDQARLRSSVNSDIVDITGTDISVDSGEKERNRKATLARLEGYSTPIRRPYSSSIYSRDSSRAPQDRPESRQVLTFWDRLEREIWPK